MNRLDVVRARLYTQHVTRPGLDTPEDVVQWLGAVQSQEYWGAKWSLAQRMKRPFDIGLDRTFSAGKILRTHILRPTWHFVTPEDIRWMQRLTAPRVRAFMAYYDRMLDLDRALLDRAAAVMVEALRGGKSLTRTELVPWLSAAGIEAKGQRLGHIIMHAELDLLICSGPLKGKQHTYMLLDERAPGPASQLDRDEALARLAKLFFTSHGPATARDFAWWSSLTVADAKTGIEMVKDSLVHEEVDGLDYWHGGALDRAPSASRAAYLLPDYDEAHIGYQDLKGVLVEAGSGRSKAWMSLMERPVIINGLSVGTWKRTFEKGGVVFAAKLFISPTPAQSRAIESAVERFGNFLGMPATLEASVV
jgi:hypothetical protein